jgi:hypothetical protein
LRAHGRLKTLDETEWGERKPCYSIGGGYSGRRWEREGKWKWRSFLGKGTEVYGIEILGLGSSYGVSLTLAHLKKACKDNGIKVGRMKKTEIIHALMKV